MDAIGGGVGVQMEAFVSQALGGGMGVGELLQQPGGIQGAQQMLQQLEQFLQSASGGPTSQALQGPQAFSPGTVDAAAMQNPMGTLMMAFLPNNQAQSQSAQMSYPKAPIVGSDSQWPAFDSAVNSRITGSDAAKQGIGFDGGNPWTKGDGHAEDRAAIGWAMQQNSSLRYNADSKTFYSTNADGSTQNVCTLDQVKAQIDAAGGANPGNGAAYQAVGSYLNGLTQNQQNAGGSSSQPASRQAPSFADVLKQILSLLQQLMQKSSGAQGAGAPQSAGGGPAASSPSGTPTTPSAGGAPAPAHHGHHAHHAHHGTAAPQSNPDTTMTAMAPSTTATPSTALAGGGSTGSAIGINSNQPAQGGNWSNIDNMEDQANQLMQSSSQSDQLKGQQLMQQASRLFEMVSQMLQQQSEMQSKAIQNMK